MQTKQPLTAEQIRQAVTDGKIEYLPMYECSICGADIGYHFFKYLGDDVVFDGSCRCARMTPRPTDFLEVAESINTMPDGLADKRRILAHLNLTEKAATAG